MAIHPVIDAAERGRSPFNQAAAAISVRPLSDVSTEHQAFNPGPVSDHLPDLRWFGPAQPKTAVGSPLKPRYLIVKKWFRLSIPYEILQLLHRQI